MKHPLDVTQRTNDQVIAESLSATINLSKPKQCQPGYPASVCVKLYRSFVRCQEQFSPKHNIFVTKGDGIEEIFRAKIKVNYQELVVKLNYCYICEKNWVKSGGSSELHKSFHLFPVECSSVYESIAIGLENV